VNRLPLPFALLATLLASTALHAQETDTHGAWASIKEIHQRMDAGQLSSAALARQFLDRIKQIDHAGPSLNSVLEINPDALKLAAELDHQRTNGPLRGIPILLKDNIDTADRMHTTA